ncbi:MAG: ribonuclease HI family protein, partial [Candidatus Krumholzibacteriota bacterium]|nr:ribonuclease HI family protein [Candidatus Krumholzibacteriota bacterium]
KAEKALLELARSLSPPEENPCLPVMPLPTPPQKNSLPVAQLIVYTDGASRGNPGPASAAAIAFLPSGEELTSRVEKIGKATNNVAEYRAVIAGLRLARDLRARRVIVKLDSQLVVRQLNGEYKIKKEELRELAQRVKSEAAGFERCRFEHVPRSENSRADELAGRVLAGEDSDR